MFINYSTQLQFKFQLFVVKNSTIEVIINYIHFDVIHTFWLKIKLLYWRKKVTIGMNGSYNKDSNSYMQS